MVLLYRHTITVLTRQSFLIFYFDKKKSPLLFNVLEQGESEDGGLLRSGIINWYLEQIEDQINDESELLEKKSFIEKILDRLIYNVS